MKKTDNFQTSTGETVTISRAEYEEQQERIARLEQQVSVLTEALRLAQHKRFGASSEKSEESIMEQLSWLMKTAKDTDLSREDTIQSLLPWNAPAECHAK